MIAGGSGSGAGGGGGGYCFLGDVLFTLSNGHEAPIHMISPLDYIMVPQPNGEIRPSRVTHKIISIAREWLHVQIGERSFGVKPNHQFRAPNGQWVEISKLDYVIQRVDDKWDLVSIDMKELRTAQHDALFYNLTVEDPAHAYMAMKCWAKNRKPDPGDEGFEF